LEHAEHIVLLVAELKLQALQLAGHWTHEPPAKMNPVWHCEQIYLLLKVLHKLQFPEHAMHLFAV
jgi:hypothetical protein